MFCWCPLQIFPCEVEVNGISTLTGRAGKPGGTEGGECAGRHSTVLSGWSLPCLGSCSSGELISLFFFKTVSPFPLRSWAEIHTSSVLMVPSDDAQWTVQNRLIPCAEWVEVCMTLGSFHIWKWWHVIDVVPAGHTNSEHVSPASWRALCYCSCPCPLTGLWIDVRIDVPSGVNLAPHETTCSKEAGGRQISQNQIPQHL